MQKDVAEAQLEALLQDVHGAESEIARAQAQREQAEAAAAEARAMLSYTLIHAPFTGRVIKKMVDVGDMATPGRPLFFVEVSTRPELHASVSESLMPYIRVGQDLSVRIDALERTVRGKVREIMPLSDPSTRTFQVKVSLPADPEFVNGLFGRLEIPHGEYDSLMIPVKAVREVGQLHLVDVLDSGGNALRRFVTLGRLRANEVEVLSGLKENEEVVIHE
jgi:RND family efflux transporter MFP subunit